MPIMADGCGDDQVTEEGEERAGRAKESESFKSTLLPVIL